MKDHEFPMISETRYTDNKRRTECGFEAMGITELAVIFVIALGGAAAVIAVLVGEIAMSRVVTRPRAGFGTPR